MTQLDFSVILTILALLLAIISQIIIPCFIKKYHSKIRLFIENNADETIKEQNAIRQAYLIEKRFEKLSSIAIITAWIELLFFILLTILLFKTAPLNSNFEIIKVFGIFIGGWLGFKILGHYPPWSNAVAGKAYYYISLITTLFNIIIAFIIGWILYIAWFKIYIKLWIGNFYF